MQSENRFFDDLAKMVNGIAGTVAGAGREAESAMRDRARRSRSAESAPRQARRRGEARGGAESGCETCRCEAGRETRCCETGNQSRGKAEGQVMRRPCEGRGRWQPCAMPIAAPAFAGATNIRGLATMRESR